MICRAQPPRSALQALLETAPLKINGLRATKGRKSSKRRANPRSRGRTRLRPRLGMEPGLLPSKAVFAPGVRDESSWLEIPWLLPVATRGNRRAMPRSLSPAIVHVIFSTKDRASFPRYRRAPGAGCLVRDRRAQRGMRGVSHRRRRRPRASGNLPFAHARHRGPGGDVENLVVEMDQDSIGGAGRHRMAAQLRMLFRRASGFGFAVRNHC